MTPEFSRPVRVDTIGEGEHTVTIDADAGERAALAARFDLVSIERLSADFTVRKEAGGIRVAGRVTGAAVQACSITGDPLPVTIDEETQLRFVEDDAREEEVELDDEAIDVLPLEGGAIDLGEAAAETLALSLDPFPRGPNAAATLAAAGVVSENEVTPLNAFAALKDKLAKKG